MSYIENIILLESPSGTTATVSHETAKRLERAGWKRSKPAKPAPDPAPRKRRKEPDEE